MRGERGASVGVIRLLSFHVAPLTPALIDKSIRDDAEKAADRARIAELEYMFKESTVVSYEKGSGVVQMGSMVKVKWNGSEMDKAADHCSEGAGRDAGRTLRLASQGTNLLSAVFIPIHGRSPLHASSGVSFPSPCGAVQMT